MMHTWFSSLWEAHSQTSPCLTIRIHRRDTILYQKQLTGSHSFTIGRSVSNPFAIDTPSLPMERFPLIQFRGKRPFIQLTQDMRGSLIWNRRILSLRELKEMSMIQPGPYGYRFEFPTDAAFNLFLDGLLIRLEWSLFEPAFPWNRKTPLIPSRPSLELMA